MALTRRFFLQGALAAAAAPAVCKAEWLMPINSRILVPDDISLGILRVNLNLVGTTTGRWSSKHPNLQELPKSSHTVTVRRHRTSFHLPR
jgi:hypothetical protein